MKETGILVVSFGTSYPDTRKKTLDGIENAFREEFGESAVYRAYTSGMIISKIKKTENLHIDNVTEALEKMKAEGFRRILVQPTHIINGQEFEKMKDMLEPFRESFESIVVGKPLLTDSEDYNNLVNVIIDDMDEIADNEVVILMGHGTGHFIDVAYAALDYRFKAEGDDRIFVATVEGYPSLEDIEEKLNERKADKVRLIPLMVVAGDHAANDMAGDEDSWKTKLEADGYRVDCVMKGLGEYEGIRKMYIQHLKDAMNPR